MGWLFMFEMAKRSDMIADRIRVWDTRRFEKKFTYTVTTCLKHCYRGNSFKGVLWTVRESNEYSSKTDVLEKSTRWIGCDILQYDSKDKCWGYKDLCESSGPNYISCPLSYLDMVPEPTEGYGVAWRKDVRAYHAERKPTFKPKIDDYVIMKDRYTERGPFRITSIKKLMGTNGRLYKIPRIGLLRKVTREELDRAKAEYPEWAITRFGVKAEEIDASKVTDDAVLTINYFLFPEVKKN